MTVVTLVQKRVEKVWGRRDLPAMFGSTPSGTDPIGEIWFEHPGGEDLDLLIKFLFTSEKLSIQVHPDDEQARCAGLARGKEEAWVLLQADPQATIGLGLQCEVSREALSGAARDGSIEGLVDWHPVKAGDFFYSPAGTIHALGAGLSLVEVQQNSDITYRLYDYGRPRALHVDEAVAVARPCPYRPPMRPYSLGVGRDILAHGRAFVLERWQGARTGTFRPALGRPLSLIPLSGEGEVAGSPLTPGSVILLETDCQFLLNEDAELLIAYSGADPVYQLIG